MTCVCESSSEWLLYYWSAVDRDADWKRQLQFRHRQKTRTGFIIWKCTWINYLCVGVYCNVCVGFIVFICRWDTASMRDTHTATWKVFIYCLNMFMQTPEQMTLHACAHKQQWNISVDINTASRCIYLSTCVTITLCSVAWQLCVGVCVALQYIHAF